VKKINSYNLILITITAFLLLSIPSSILCEESQGNHQKLAEEAGCLTCHISPPANQDNAQTATISVKLKKNAGQWCVSCHDMEAKTLHPTGITTQTKHELPLEEEKFMSCLTCHSPHKQRYDKKSWVAEGMTKETDKGFKTFILNHSNINGELCQKCHNDEIEKVRNTMHKPRAFSARGYAGSSTCKQCHLEIYESWKITPHAKMTRKLNKLEKKEKINLEELNWPREKIKYVLGSHYVHRFVAEASGTLIVLPKIWDISKKEWLPAKDHGWKNRFWKKQCAGCHTTGFNSEDDSFVETGVACESCHGPGLNHSRTSSPKFIVAPKKLSKQRYDMICESCHTSGLNNTGEYHFPTTYKPGEDLTKHFSGLTPKPGQDPTNFKGDETYEDRHRQWEFLKSRLYLAQGLTCDYCQNFRNFESNSKTAYLTRAEYCLTCHTDKKNHPEDEEEPGTNCSACHESTLTASGTISIHDHKFGFGKQD
jgi:nitrate/TMAO reductase-like tetraheme cytochrome c subunit